MASVISQIRGPVFAVGHSYGGAVITNAVPQTRNVVGLVYVAAFAPDEGETIAGIVGRSQDSVLLGAVLEKQFPIGEGPQRSLGHSSARKAEASSAGISKARQGRRFPWTNAPGYVIAQFAGATAAAATWALRGNQARTQASLAATYPAAGVAPARVFAAEAIVTFILVLVITSVTTDSQIPGPAPT